MQTYYIDGAAGILPSSDQIYTDSFYYATVRHCLSLPFHGLFTAFP